MLVRGMFTMASSTGSPAPSVTRPQIVPSVAVAGFRQDMAGRGADQVKMLAGAYVVYQDQSVDQQLASQAHRSPTVPT
jgi:hypothetical protein